MKNILETPGRLLKSLSTKVNLVITLMVLPISLIGIKQSNDARRSIVEQCRISAENIADVQLNELGQRIENHQLLLSYLLTKDTDCIRMTHQPEDVFTYDSTKYRFFKTLENMASMMSGGDGYYFFMKEKDDMLMYYNRYENNGMRNELSAFIRKYSGDAACLGWNIVHLSEGTYLVLILNLPQLVYGGWIALDPIGKNIADILEYEKIQIFFSSNLLEPVSDRWVSASADTKGLYLTVLMDRQELSGAISQTDMIIRTLVFLNFFLIPFIYIVMHWILLKPLLTLNQAHAEIQNGNRAYRIRKKAKSIEYKEAYSSFNHMADALETLRIKSYEKEIARQKMELKNLQLQIQPHFLQNTFNLLFTLAQRNEHDAVQNIVLYLSNYFRYIFRENKELELFSKELNLIEGYVQMASIRYNGRIRIEYRLDPEISFVRTPPLLIHNFIENSVKHGINEQRDLLITLEGYYQEQKVVFIISDNGNGMSEERTAQIRKSLEIFDQEDSCNVGIRNSVKRLKYLYGESAMIQIESMKGEGTSFVIVIPYDLEVGV